MSDKTETSTPRTDAILQVDCVGDDFSPLIEHARTLERELAEARKDAERIDWLERRLFERKWDGTIGRPPSWFMVGDFRHVVQNMTGATLRAAIDSAKAGGKHGKAHHD